MAALSVPSVAFVSAIRLWGLTMSVFYICSDGEIDAERCRISLHKEVPITVFGLSTEGRATPYTGIVQSIKFDSQREPGTRWCVCELAPSRDEGTDETVTSAIGR
jgi:hypothetical protein